MARFGEPLAQPPAGFAHRFGEIRGFGAGEIRGKSACVGGKRVAPLDRFLESRAVTRVPVERAPGGVGFAQRLGGGVPRPRAGGFEHSFTSVLRLELIECGLDVAP